VTDRFFRRALLATAAMNAVGAVLLAPPFPAVRRLVGVPEAPALYGWLLALWILFFGLGYWRLAHARTPERLFLQVATAGKVSFPLVLAAYWLGGALPAAAPLSAAPDLAFAAVFAQRLWETRVRR
jgi:hypothetical protein